jgi:hypothetical protein
MASLLNESVDLTDDQPALPHVQVAGVCAIHASIINHHISQIQAEPVHSEAPEQQQSTETETQHSSEAHISRAASKTSLVCMC